MATMKVLNENNPIQDGKPLTFLIILDGFGLADPKNEGNAITPETAPNIFKYIKEYPSAKLEASGVEVGLFPGQRGNSEAGHLNIGTGRVVKQDLVMISEAVHDGTFFKNESFKQALYHVKKYQTSAHIFSLLTGDHSPHAYPEHLYATLEYFRKQNYANVYLHLFTDGRDSSPHGAATFLHELRGHMLSHEKIATMTGRFYAMDRGKNWARTKKVYEALVMGKGYTALSAEAALEQSYNRGDTDEFLSPTIIVEEGKPIIKIKDNDAIFFINARSDRARQLAKVFGQPDFEEKNPGSFKRENKPKNIRFVAMTDFGPDLPSVFTAFPSPDHKNGLAKVIGEGYKQLYISETEKYAHVTYFINGGYAEPINGEERVLVKSSAVRSYDLKPEMMAKEMTNKIIKYVEKNVYNFVAVNYPNADMVGHTGNTEAAKKAISVLDVQVKRLVDIVLEKDGQVLIVSDHGNAEQMINIKTGEMMTEHSVNPVPIVMIRKGLKNVKLKDGKLADVAPTLLKMMGVEKAADMTGESLF